ncbi:MAG: metal-sulfur cluster biosynthetic enzyme [Halobacteriales archaeon]|jgi:metal-sulfur cluster biosynthetic enzyme
MVTEDDVLEALKTVQDPEIPINIVDLGLIYDVEIDDGEVHVDMTLTTMGCPIADYFLQEATEAAESVDGVEEADVDLVWDPPWSPEKATEDGKAQLQSLGISI